MQNFESRRQTKILFGLDQERELGSLIKSCGGTRVLVHYGDNSVLESELIDTVRRTLEEAGLDFYELGGALPNPRLDLVARGVRLAETNNLDFILALGGDSVISSAKAIAAAASYLGDVSSLFRNEQPIERALPVGCVVTLPGSGAEISDTLTVTEQNGDGSLGLYFKSAACLMPAFAVLNPRLITPFPQMAGACAAEMLVGIIEGYFTTTRAVRVTDGICQSLMCSVIESYKRIQEDPHNYETLANFIWAGTLSHGEIFLDRERDQALERFARALMCRYDCTHAEAAALILPAWLEAVVEHNHMRMAGLGANVFGLMLNYENPRVTARETIAKFRDFLKSCGMPQHLSDIGGDARDVIKLLDSLGVTEGNTIGNYVKLTRADCEVIFSVVQLKNLLP